MEDGILFHVHAETEVGGVDFDCWHLRKEVYEGPVREAGLKGEAEVAGYECAGEVFEGREGGVGELWEGVRLWVVGC